MLDTIDDSAYLRVPRKQTAAPAPQTFPHTWLTIRLGRVCEACMCTQSTGEFVDTGDCLRNRSAKT